jgi:hypothetical protein
MTTYIMTKDEKATTMTKEELKPELFEALSKKKQKNVRINSKQKLNNTHANPYERMDKLMSGACMSKKDMTLLFKGVKIIW